VTEATISKLATDNLPTKQDFAAYVAFSQAAPGQQSQLAQLASQIVAASGVNVGGLVTEMQAWSNTMPFLRFLHEEHEAGPAGNLMEQQLAPRLLRLLAAGAKVAGWVCFPLGNRAFPWRT
jgi:hypothetical protein